MTCDYWQALNADAYFAVTIHWIEGIESGEWVLESAIAGFVRLNTRHTGATLGNALFRVLD